MNINKYSGHMGGYRIINQEDSASIYKPDHTATIYAIKKDDFSKIGLGIQEQLHLPTDSRLIAFRYKKLLKTKELNKNVSL